MKRLIDQFPEIAFFVHSSNFIDIKGNYLGPWKCPLPTSPKIINSTLMTERLLIQNFISITAPIIKREIAQKVGGLDETLWYTADWDLWLKIANCGDSMYCPKPLSGFRVHLNSQTIVRSSYLQDFRKQLESVANKHFMLWDAPESLKKKNYKIAVFSVNVNTALAGTLHRENPGLFRLLINFLPLGPIGWYRYFINSRIWERVLARLKARLTTRPE
jgi:hypothetical protein